MRNPLVKLISLQYKEFNPGRTVCVWMFLIVVLLLGCGAGDTIITLASLSNPIHIVVETNTGGATALVLEQQSGVISRINLDTLEVTGTLITGLNNPEGFAIEPGGPGETSVLVIENTVPVRLVKANLSNKNISNLCPPLNLNSPTGMVRENNGDVLVTTNGGLFRINFNQGGCIVTRVDSNLSNLTGIALELSTNSVLVTNSSDGKLIRISLDNSSPPEDLALNLMSPSGVAPLSTGGALVVQTGNGSVVKIAGSQLPSPSTIVTTIKTGLNSPRGIALNSQENTAFVTETNPGQIVQISIPFP